MSDQAEPVPLRPAATVLIVRDDPFEVLLLKRHERAYLGSALVFPGGVVEAEDGAEAWAPFLRGAEDLDIQERAYRVAACREVFEECAILLATPATGTETAAVPAPAQHLSSGEFLRMMRARGGQLTLDALVPFAHWITPAMAPKRFDTRFLICRAPPAYQAVADGAEIVSLAWVSPQEALRAAAAGEITLAFPTRMNLRRLSESSDSTSALAAARRRPHFAVQPVVVETPTGRALRISPDAGYGVAGEDLPPI